jgi:hypothetical protein
MEQSKMFSDAEVFQKERPHTLTNAQLGKFFTDMAKEVKKNNWSCDSIEDIAEDLSDLNLNQNGFEMGKDLEGYNRKANYEIEVDFLEFLESLEYSKMQIVNQNVKDWVKAHDIKPKLNKGYEFIGSNKLHTKMRGEELVITDIYEDTAQYVVRLKNSNKKTGYLIDFEKVEEKV